MQKPSVRSGVRTHAHLRVPELKSGALDHSANLTLVIGGEIYKNIFLLLISRGEVCNSSNYETTFENGYFRGGL